MKQNALIAGTGMTRFGKYLDRGLKSLAGEAIKEALKDAGISRTDIQAAWVGTSAAGIITGQVCVPGQVVLRELGIGKIPVVNVENACATASTAFQQACTMITAGVYDIALAVGMEKLYHPDKQRTFEVFTGALDVENLNNVICQVEANIQAAGVELDTRGGRSKRSIFMDIYVAWAVQHMKDYGTTQRQFAAVAAKNSFHGSLNPRAQFRNELSIDEVLAEREIAWPLTLPMCSPISDGAAAVILVSPRKARELGLEKNAVKVRASVLASGWDYKEGTAVEDELAQTVANTVYEEAGVGPSELSCIELHDATAPSEILYYEHLGLCPRGEGGRFIEDGQSRLGGKVPVNTSGGLLRRGHPIGATGIAQIVELNEQLRGRAGRRQVSGARVALAENGGGYISNDSAVLVMSILSR